MDSSPTSLTETAGETDEESIRFFDFFDALRVEYENKMTCSPSRCAEALEYLTKLRHRVSQGRQRNIVEVVSLDITCLLLTALMWIVEQEKLGTYTTAGQLDVRLELMKMIAFILADATANRTWIESVGKRLLTERLDTFKSVLVAILDVCGETERCVPLVSAIRAVVNIDGVPQFFLRAQLLPSTGDKDNENGRSAGGSCEGTLVGCIAAHLKSNNVILCHEMWELARSLLLGSPSAADEYIVNSLEHVVPVFVDCLESPNVVARLGALHLIASLLVQQKMKKARTLLAESPALLCAILALTSNPEGYMDIPSRDAFDTFRGEPAFVYTRSTIYRQVQVLTYAALRTFIGKPQKPAPIRFILQVNHDTLVRYVDAHATQALSTLSYSMHIAKEVIAQESLAILEDKRLLLENLACIEPLTHEEALLLGVECD